MNYDRAIAIASVVVALASIFQNWRQSRRNERLQRDLAESHERESELREGRIETKISRIDTTPRWQ